MTPGTRVRVHPAWGCPGNGRVHGGPELVDGARGIVLEPSPPMPPEMIPHPIKVGLEWGFSYFREDELEVCP